MRIAFWLAAVFSLVMALLPQPPSLAMDKLGDKFEHMLAFAVLTLLARLGWPQARLLIIIAALSLFGAAIELFQMIPALHRDADLRDWVADSVAIASMGVLAQFLIQFWPKRDMN